MFITLTIKTISAANQYDIHVRTTSITSIIAHGKGSTVSVMGIPDIVVCENPEQILNAILDKESCK